MKWIINRLRQLKDFGPKVWEDELRREKLVSDKLIRLIENDGICGVTSNPTILQKAFS